MSEIIISDHNGEPVANSLEVAKNFDKNHKDVLKAIKNIRAQICALTPEPLFFEATYQSGTGKHYKCYEMTKDGFVLLAMGFSGQKALAWKLKYIQAFNEMEKALTNRQEYGKIEDRNECSFDWYENISAHNFGNISCFSFFC
jgi:Rha family phage regulatory protein